MPRPKTGRNPRINITVSKEVYKTLFSIADLVGVPATTLTAKMITDMLPHLKEMEKGLLKYKAGEDGSREMMASQLQAVQKSNDEIVSWLKDNKEVKS